ncbi:MAG: hypothetical protein A2046_03935 [Bacteroidetes bacterium GWA2_30_7]|nr:MAG: hypothetical protein A2046_03935 [Bacteroidetes bacterium GWA2_30_7]
MPNLSKTYLYRMTHIKNIPHILKYGITHYSSFNSNPNFMPIGDCSLINSRNSFILNNGRTLGEYIPFYFGVRTPMLYVVQNGYNMVSPTPAENIVYCVTSVQKIIDLKLDFIFTNGHAIDCFTSQFTPDNIQNIDNIIDKNAVNSKYWKDDSDLDLKRRKEAEFLVLGDIASEGILGFLVYNQNAQNIMIDFGVKDVHIKTSYYF